MSGETRVEFDREGYGRVVWPEGDGPLALQGPAAMRGVLAAADRRPGQAPPNNDIERRLDKLEAEVRKIWRAIRKLAKGIGSIRVYDNVLEEDTATATVNEWVDLPGVSRTLAFNRPSTVFVNVQLRVKTAPTGAAIGAQVVGRLLVNNGEKGSRGIWSRSRNLALPGAPTEITENLTFSAVVDVNNKDAYTFKVQVANLVDTHSYTVEVGPVADSRMTIMVLPRRQNEQGEDTTQPVRGNGRINWIGAGFDQANDRLLVLRVNAIWTTGTVGSGTPNKAWLELVSYTRSQLPINDVIGSGQLVFRWPLEDLATWSNYISIPAAVAIDASNGMIFVNYYRLVSGNTAKGYVRLISPAGYTIESADYDCNNYVTAESAPSAIFNGSSVFSIERTTDTTAQSGTPPFKSGYRVVKRSTTDLSITAEDDIDTAVTSRLRIPVAIVPNGADAYLYVKELLTLTPETWEVYRCAFAATIGADSQVLGSETDLPQSGNAIAERDTSFVVRTETGDVYAFTGSAATYGTLLSDDGAVESDGYGILVAADDECFAWDRAAQTAIDEPILFAIAGT